MVKIALRHVIPKLLPSSSIEKTTKKKTLNGQYIVLFPVEIDNDDETQIEIHFGKHISIITNPDMLMESNYVAHKIDSLILPNMSEFVKPEGMTRMKKNEKPKPGTSGGSGSTGTKPKKPETRGPPKPDKPIVPQKPIIKKIIDKIKPKPKPDDKKPLLGSGDSSRSGSDTSLNGKVL